MTTILRFQPADLLQCRFALSPLGEVTDAAWKACLGEGESFRDFRPEAERIV